MLINKFNITTDFFNYGIFVNKVLDTQERLDKMTRVSYSLTKSLVQFQPEVYAISLKLL